MDDKQQPKKTESAARHEHGHGQAGDDKPLEIQHKPFSLLQKMSVCVFVVIIGVVIFFGITSRRAAIAALQENTEHAATPTVNVVPVALGNDQGELVLPGNTQAFSDAAVYARTNGYLEAWTSDIGAHVKRGQVLAEIGTPELDRQLQQARADVQTAQTNAEQAHATAERWEGLLKQNAVSKQDTEQNVSDYHAKLSSVDSAKANVARLEQLQAFEKVRAPFDGVITARNTDIGALIDAGSGTPRELFHIANVAKLRVFVPVPEAESGVAVEGAHVVLTLDEFPGRRFTGIITRNTNSIDPATRTLKVEIDVDNPTEEIKSGAYVLAHFPILAGNKSLTIPVNALLFRSEGPRAAVVRGDSKAYLVPITIGRDLGSSLEVLAGLVPGDKVIVNPSDSLTSGTAVKIADQGAAAAH